MVKSKSLKSSIGSKLSRSSKSSRGSSVSQKTYTINRENGIYDPVGIHNNPLTNQPYKNLFPQTYADLGKLWSKKIVYDNKDKIIDTITNNQIILLTAGTGVGKTILVPRIALHAFNYKEKVLCTIPTRISTFSTSGFVAKCMDVNIGEEVGYYYQGTNQTNKNGIETKLIFTTPGSLLSRMTGSDPLLSDYKCIIVDEAHQRSVDIDQLLLLLKKACRLRKDLKVIIMSATIDLKRFKDYFPKNQFLFGEVDAGSELSFPIKEAWLDKKPDDWKKVAIDITMNILKKTAVGDIMIFVKAGGDAKQLCILLDKAMGDLRKKIITEQRKGSRNGSRKGSRNGSRKGTQKGSHKASRQTIKTRKSIPPEYLINPFCIKLDGGTPKDDQEMAIDQNRYKNLKDEKGHPYSRKVVITTNVAESSITVDGIVFIIDSGFEYTDSYEPNTRIRSLLENTIAQSAVKQRKGRAGRTQPGYCFHLYSQSDYKSYIEYPIPNIEKSDITNDILNLMRLPTASTVKTVRELLDEFISPPHEKFILNSLRTLQALGAITSLTPEGTITPMGFIISKFRVIKANHARSLIASYFYGCSRSVCDIIALITVADGRIDSIFQEYYPDKKKSAEWNKKESLRYMQIMKTLSHPLGDYMTLLKAYKMYLKIIDTLPKPLQQGQSPQQSQSPQASPTIDNPDVMLNESDANVLLELDLPVDEKGKGQEPQEQSQSLKRWCRDNFLNANKLALARRMSRQMHDTLLKAIHPVEFHYKKQESNLDIKQNMQHMQNMQNMKNKQNINPDAKNFKSVDDVMVDIEPVLPPLAKKHSIDTKKEMDKYNAQLQINKLPKHMQMQPKARKQKHSHKQGQTPIQTPIQTAGYIQHIEKEEARQKLEQNVQRFATEEDNIMMALAIGNFVNFAIKVKNDNKGGKQMQGDAYTSCFAQTKKFAKINKESFLNTYPQVIMYDEMFMMSKDAKFVKLNIVGKIPDNVFQRIKELYGQYIRYCI